ncbi:MAG TPA: response regulator [Candidatus Eremiobacteraceae bacterium]|nr:response regulator [Candidatus Eremiobacteraceae bacterium]
MRKWKAVIVDDEELARKLLREMLSTHPEIEIAAECGNGMDAVKAAGEHKPDLLFLDVQMPKLTGFDVLELIDRGSMAVIFVTAFDQYAMKAFDVHAVDYLLKPFSRVRFEAALDRAKQQEGKKQVDAAELAAASRPAGQYAERIVVKDGTKVSLIPVNKLEYAEALDDYVSLVSEGKKHLKQQTISGLEMALNPAMFVRIHRSYIVNLERVARIEPYGKDSKVAILSSGVKLPVSRAGYGRLKTLLEER